jgi:hypothetical protein
MSSASYDENYCVSLRIPVYYSLTALSEPPDMLFNL